MAKGNHPFIYVYPFIFACMPDVYGGQRAPVYIQSVRFKMHRPTANQLDKTEFCGITHSWLTVFWTVMEY